MMSTKTFVMSAAMCLSGLVIVGCDKGSDTTPPAVSNAQSSAEHQDAKSSASSAADSAKDAMSKTGDAMKSEADAAKDKMSATTMPSMSTPSTMP